MLVEADKSASFAVLRLVVFKEKKSDAINDSFITLSGNVKKEKSMVCALFQKSERLSALKAIRGQVGARFPSKFLLNDQKPSLPVRVVVYGRGSWQGVLSRFLQICLSHLRLSGYISFKNADELVSQLDHFDQKFAILVFLNIKDLCFSLDQVLVFKRVGDALEVHTLADFQTSTGISIEAFLELLQLYLDSSVVDFNRGLMIQKRRVCTGSVLSFVLSEIYLNGLDQAVTSFVKGLPGDVLLTCRYVDDFLFRSVNNAYLSQVDA